MAIHPTALIESGARVHATADIGPFCIVGPKVTIGPGTRLLHSVTVTGRTTLGARNVVHPYCVVGGDPQDLKFRGEDSVLVIGDENVFREGVTLNKGTQFGGNQTVIGTRNFIMTMAHVAHDCIIGDEVIIANACLLAGHVRIESHAIVSGWVVIHHFVTVGQYAFIGGGSRLNQDCPPFMKLSGIDAAIYGVNSVGLKRRGFKPEVVNALRDAQRTIFRAGLPRPEALSEVEKRFGEIAEIRTLLDFMWASDRGNLGRAREPRRAAPGDADPEAEPVA